jgi:HK97 gp10 family phage protein
MRVLTLPGWIAELAGSSVDVGRKASEIVRAAAYQAQGLARQTVPVDTGFLRASITVGHPSGRDTLPGDLEAQVGPEASYGAYVEYGTPNVGPRPYMNPAAELVGQLMAQRMAKELGPQ